MRLSSFQGAAIVASFVLLIACSGPRNVVQEQVSFQLGASAQPYISAMGAGRGVVFRIWFIQPEQVHYKDLTVDSLMIHGIRVDAEKIQEQDSFRIEANYYKATPEPALGEQVLQPVTDSPDPILILSQYQPAMLHLHYQGQAYHLPIEKFERISE